MWIKNWIEFVYEGIKGIRIQNPTVLNSVIIKCYLLSVFFTRWWVVFYAFKVGWWHCLSDKITYKFIKCCLGDNPSRFARPQLCWYDLYIFSFFSTLISVPVIFTCTTITHRDTLSKLKSRALRNLKRWASFGIYNRNRDHLVRD